MNRSRHRETFLIFPTFRILKCFSRSAVLFSETPEKWEIDLNLRRLRLRTPAISLSLIAGHHTRANKAVRDKLNTVTADPTADSPGEASKQIPSAAGMTTKVVKGSMWTLAGQVAPLLVSLVTTPFVIRMLGAEGYGVFILIGLIPTYFGFADFGMSIASTKFGSEAYAANDPDREARVVRTAAVIAFLASLPVALAIALLSGGIITLFNVPDHLRGEASFALKFAAVTFVVSFLNGILNTPQLARLRMDLNTLVTSGFRIIGIAATPIVIYLGGGILGAVVVLFVASVLTLVGHLYVSGRLLPTLFDITLDSRAVRALVRFGSALVSVGIAGVILINIEKGLLASLVSVKALAYYTVAFMLANMMVLFSNTMIQSLVPAFSQLNQLDSRAQFEALYTRIVKVCVIGLIPVAAFLIFAARDLIGVWAGSEFSVQSTTPFYILLAGLLLSVPGYIPYSVLMGIGKASVIAKLYWLEIVPYLAIVYFLTINFGIVGTAAAWSARVAFDGVLFFVLARKTSSADLRLMNKGTSWLSVGIAPYLVMTAFVLLSDGAIAPVTALIFFAATVVYAAIVWKLILVPEERDWLWSFTRSFRMAR